MKSSKVLEMISDGRINELEAALRDEIYTEALKTKRGAKSRYSYMKKYLSYVDTVREILKKPCEVEIEDNTYTAFCNSYSLALTREKCGEIELCDDPYRYPPVAKLIKYGGKEGKIDFTKVLAEAKSKGYKLKKTGLMSNEYLMHYDGAYFRIALVDITYGIVDDEKEAIVYHSPGARQSLTVTTDIGVCVIMPVFIDDDTINEYVVIEAE